MGQFTEKQLESSITAGIRAFHVAKGYSFGLVDPALIASITAEVTKLFDWAAATPNADEEIIPGPMVAGEALLAPFSDPVAIRIAAYELALKHPNAVWGRHEVHRFASEIANNVENNFPTETTLEVKINVVAPDLSAFRRSVDSIWGKTEHRREGWNDLKALMIRKLTKQIKHPDDDSYILRDYSRAKLEKIRDFIASFNFDPNHEK